MWTHLVRRLQPVFVVLALVFIAFLLRSQWEELQSHPWQLNLAWLAGSALFLLLAWAVEIALWRHLLLLLGGRLPYAPAVRIWFLSAIVRYIPGNIWQPLSMTLLCQRRGISPEATLTSVVLYQVLIILAVAPLAAVYFWFTGNWGLLTDLLSQATPWLIAGGLLPVVVFLARPGWLIDMINWGLHRLHRPVLASGLSRGQLVWVLIMAMADWLLWGVSFATLAFALNIYSPAEMWALAPHLVAAYPVAYAIGFISFITPSGLGVREGAFYVLLAPLLGGGAVTAIALAMRIWTTAGELLAAGASVLLHRQAAALAVPAADAPVELADPGELHKRLT